MRAAPTRTGSARYGQPEGAEDQAPETAAQARPPVDPAHPQRVRPARGAAVRGQGRGRHGSKWSRDLPSVPSSVTVIREPDGRYYASFVVEREATPLPACDREVGIDLGLNSLVVTSDGETVANPRFLPGGAAAAAPGAAGAVPRRKAPRTGPGPGTGSRCCTARCGKRGSTTRTRWLCGWSATTKRSTPRTLRVRPGPHPAGQVGRRCRLVAAAAVHRGEGGAVRPHFARIGRFEPTSQVCSACGVKDGPKPLSVRAVDLPGLRDGPRPGRERGKEHIGGRGGSRQTKRLWSRCKTTLPWLLVLKQEPTGARREPR